MGDRSAIEWTDATWNPITGCSLVSEGCRHCYAATLAATRLKNHPSRAGLARVNAAGEAKFTGEVRFNAEWLDQPLRWRRPRRIFVCAHGDLFHEAVPDVWIERVFAVMALAEQHQFQVLTKRPARAQQFIASRPRDRVKPRQAVISTELADSDSHYSVPWPLPNLWLGTSVENRETAGGRCWDLAHTPAAVRFWSVEPLLADLGDLTTLCLRDTATDGRPAVHWVIVGGESGPGARPMHPDWARSIRDQCQAAGVPFFFKQWGEWAPVGDLASEQAESLEIEDRYEHVFSHRSGGHGRNGQDMVRVGKKRAGRELDGRTWDELPEASHG